MAPITEEDLLRDFEKYIKILQELESLYGVLPVEASGIIEEPDYISEANFSYEVHTSSSKLLDFGNTSAPTKDLHSIILVCRGYTLGEAST